MKKPITIREKTLPKLFRAYVEILQPILRLRNREADILAQILYYNNEKKDIVEGDRFELILSTPYRKKIKENLNIKDSTLQNSLSILRKKGILKDGKVLPELQVFIENELDLIFKFKLKNEE